MHLVLPFAHVAGPAATQTLAALRLPHLERLLAGPPAGGVVPGGAPATEDAEFTLSPPHERLLAQLRGWPAQDGLLPLAAEAARADGLHPQVGDGQGWALLSPTHWHLGTEQVSLTDPAALGLDEADSRALFEAVRPLFDLDGWALHWGCASRWYATHPSLAVLPTAALDRVIGRNVDLWLNEHPEQRQALRHTRRLQAEVQMLLHGHPVNQAREARGLRTVNSVWLSGTGPTQPPAAETDARLGLRVDTRLRAAALAEDMPAWAAAWAELDAGPLAELARAAESAPAGAPLALSLCGERHSLTLHPRRPGWWQRLWGTGPARAPALLASL